MCSVRVFNFVKKEDHQYEITIFKSRERILPLVAHLFPLPISLLFPQQKTKSLHSSSLSTPQNIHGWTSRSLDLISTVSIPRSSPRSSFCRRRPIIPRSKFESHCIFGFGAWRDERKIKKSWSVWKLWKWVSSLCTISLYIWVWGVKRRDYKEERRQRLKIKLIRWVRAQSKKVDNWVQFYYGSAIKNISLLFKINSEHILKNVV